MSPAPNLSGYKVAASELSSSTKFNNLVQAIQDEFGDIDADQIPGYPSDGTKVLLGDGSWGSISSTIALSTSLPGSPTNGDKVILVDSTSAPTYQWLLQFVSAKASNKWVCIGGVPQISEVATSENLNSASYVALATAHTLSVPIAGDYIVDHGFKWASGGSDKIVSMSYDIGGTGAVDADAVRNGVAAGGSPGERSVSRSKKKAGLTAVTLTFKFKTDTAVSTNVENRWGQLMPIAIGG